MAAVIDPVALGIMVLVSVIVSPLVVFALYFGGHPYIQQQEAVATAAHNGSQEQQQIIAEGSTAEFNDLTSGIQGKNPEEVLANADNQGAISEIDGCTSYPSSTYNDLLPGIGSHCKAMMSMLIHSCEDSTTRVNACDDPRLVEYKAGILKTNSAAS
jgi:hypothetical protein